MKARRRTALPGLLLSLLVMLPAASPAAAEQMLLTENDSGGYILLAAGQRFNLSLGSSASTGYAWHIVELDRSVVDVAGFSSTSSAPRPGSGGWSNWTFESKRGGETTLRLERSRSGQGPGGPAETFSVHIVVGTGNTAWNVSFLAAAAIAALAAAELARRRRERAAPRASAARQGLAGRLLHPRTAGAMGLAGVLAVSAGLAGSIAMYPRFSLWDSNLSDLGVTAGGPFFNWGLILCGVLGALLALSSMLHLARGSRLRMAGFALLAVALTFLASIGIFTESFSTVHYYVAVAFFTLFALASLVVGISLSQEDDLRWIGRLALLSAAMGVVAWFLPSGKGIAIPELAASVLGQLWLALLGYRMARPRPA